MKTTKIKFQIIKSNHLLINVKINEIKGRFILDTGASNCCVCFENTEKFNLITFETKVKAAGAGAINLETLQSKKNTLEIGKIKIKKFELVLINMQHIKQSLVSFYKKPIDGVIGSDILIKTNALIDYRKKTITLFYK